MSVLALTLNDPGKIGTDGAETDEVDRSGTGEVDRSGIDEIGSSGTNDADRSGTKGWPCALSAILIWHSVSGSEPLFP